jgi:hypothetical protein
MSLNDGFPTDFLFGSFEFATEMRKEGDVYIASALGVEARHRDQSQALNDLNQKISDGLERGTIRPDNN